MRAHGTCQKAAPSFLSLLTFKPLFRFHSFVFPPYLHMICGGGSLYVVASRVHRSGRCPSCLLVTSRPDHNDLVCSRQEAQLKDQRTPLLYTPDSLPLMPCKAVRSHRRTRGLHAGASSLQPSNSCPSFSLRLRVIDSKGLRLIITLDKPEVKFLGSRQLIKRRQRRGFRATFRSWRCYVAGALIRYVA